MPVIDNTIKFVIVRNPLVPDSRIIVERDYVEGQTLYDYIGELKGQFTIVLNGVHVEQHKLNEHKPVGGDIVGIAPVPAGGGGGGKDIIRLVAIVALAVVTAGAAAAIYTTGWAAMGIAAGGVGAAMLAAGTAAVIGIGGNLLINKLLPPQMPKVDSSSSSSSTSQTYGADGAKNTSTEGIPVPVIYGFYRTAGNLIATHTTMSGQDQWLHMLINAGEGVIATLDTSTILINDQKLSSFGSDAIVEFANGNGGQNSFPEFSAQITSNQVQNMRDIDTDMSWTVFNTSADKEIEAVEVGLLSTIYKINSSSGNQESHSVNVKVQFRNYASTDDGDWADIRSGIKAKYIGKGWHFTNAPGVTGMFDPAGATVTEQKVGSQWIDPTRPNKYNTSTGLFQNYYLYDGSKYYNLQGEAVAQNGSTVQTSRFGFYPERIIAPSKKTDTSGLTSYDYGNLICNGQIVGKYHRFHNSNPSVPSYNGSGMLLGTKAAETNITLSGSTTATSRSFFRSPRLPEGRYSVRVCRIGNKSTSSTVSEGIVFNEVNEILYSDIHYNYTALLRVSVKTTSNLSSIPTVTFINTGRVIRAWDDKAKRFVPSFKSYGALWGGTHYDCPITSWENSTFPTLTASENAIVGKSTMGNKNMFPNVMAFQRPAHLLAVGDSTIYNSDGFFAHNNPAWVALDMLTDSRIGGGLDPTRIDFWAFKEWADYCTSKGLYFNGVFDSQETLWDQLSVVFRIGRANPLRVGTRYSVAIEKPKLEVQAFGQDAIKQGSFAVNWLPVTDRANEVEVTFYDKSYDYKQRIIKIYDQSSIDTGRKTVSTSMKLIGVTDYNQAVKEANFALNSNKLVETVSFTVPVSSIACTIGDVIRVQHNMMNWGEAGKLLDITSLPSSQYSLKLDHPITFATGESWSVMVHYDFASKGIFTVKSKSDNYIVLTGFTDLQTQATRVMVAGIDQKIVNTFQKADGTGDCGIYVEDPTVFIVGQSVQLFATNVMEVASVVPSVYGTPTDVITATLSSAPNKYASFMVGKVNFTSKLFTVRAITLASDSLERSITALEYDSRVFDDSNTNFNIVEAMDIKRLSPVENVEASEMPRYDGNTANIDVSIYWTHSDVRYKSAAVYVSANSAKETSLGAHTSTTVYTANSKDYLRFRIVPYDGLNNAGAEKVFALQLSDLATGYSLTKPTSGVIKNTASGNKIVVTTDTSDLGIKQVEVWAVTESTLIDGVAVTPAKAATLTSGQIQTAGKILGHVSDTGEFIHVAETDAQSLKTFYYFSCAVDYAGNKSGFTYIGASKPVTAVSYNTVSVYCLSALVPSKPTGGSYQTPTPDGTVWKVVPPTRAADDDVSLLWVSSRRFSNFVDVQDSTWSDPSAISSPVPDVSGQLLKTWVAYANDTSGTNFSHTYDPSKHKWRGVSYNHPVDEVVSNAYGDYEWQLIVTLTDVMTTDQRTTLNNIKDGKLFDGTELATINDLGTATTTFQTYADTMRVTNSLINASFAMPLINSSWPYWTITNSGLTSLTAERRDGATDTTWGLNSGFTASLAQSSIVGSSTVYAEITQKRSVIAGQRYGFSVYTGALRCKMEAFVRFYNASNTLLSTTAASVNNAEKTGGASISGYKRLVSYGDAPAGAVYAICVIKKYDTATGQTNSYAMFTQAQFGDWSSSQVLAPNWCQGIEPTVADSSITASKLAVAAIDSATGAIKSGAVTDASIAAGAVKANKLAVRKHIIY